MKIKKLFTRNENKNYNMKNIDVIESQSYLPSTTKKDLIQMK